MEEEDEDEDEDRTEAEERPLTMKVGWDKETVEQAGHLLNRTGTQRFR